MWASAANDRNQCLSSYVGGWIAHPNGLCESVIYSQEQVVPSLPSSGFIHSRQRPTSSHKPARQSLASPVLVDLISELFTVLIS